MKTKAQAEAAITAVANWLKEYKEPSHEKVIGPNYQGKEMHNAQLARDWSHQLLKASTADGEGGCQLCKN